MKKLYVIPVENCCNAACPCCITRFKKENKFGEELDPKVIAKGLQSLSGIEKIEITGGGEPFWHRDIDSIISHCVDVAPTQIYTNGEILHSNLEHYPNLHRINTLCLSRLHHCDYCNSQLMAIEYDIHKIAELQIPLKLSLVLLQSGIHDARGLWEYLIWAKHSVGAEKVVVRQMFEFDYPEKIKHEYISSMAVFQEMGFSMQDYVVDPQGNPIFDFHGMEVEIEIRSCACEIFHPVMRANGNIYVGWTDKSYEEK